MSPERRLRDAFYSSRAWIALRDRKRRMNPVCERCLARGFVRAVEIVHHRQTTEERWDLRLDLDNLESLCNACHNAEHKGKP